MPRLKPLLRAARDLAYRVAYRGTSRWCPVCEHTLRRFAPRPMVGSRRRTGVMCPHCGAYERHREVWLFFERKTDLFTRRNTQVLHVAPERCFERRFRTRIGRGYLTADLNDASADVRMDITNIQYPDQTFDVIYCSHVLEHVPDDRAALREFHRVLKRDGWAVILVPITVAETLEDPTITSPKERKRLYGLRDHVRRYGRDFVGRLTEAGFNVQVFDASDIADRSEITRMGLTPGTGDIFLCRK